MRKAVFAVMVLFCAAVTAWGDCSHVINVGADPKNPNRQIMNGEFVIRLKAPLCVDENAAHKDHVVGTLRQGTEIVVTRGEGDKLIPRWVRGCGNDINRVFADHIEYESGDIPSVYDDSYYYENSAPARSTERDVYRERDVQRDNGDRYMTREEFLAALQAMQPRVSRLDRALQVGGLALGALGVYESFRTQQALRHPITVRPVPCFGVPCGVKTPPTITPPNCPYCTPGHGTRPPCAPGNTC